MFAKRIDQAMGTASSRRWRANHGESRKVDRDLKRDPRSTEEGNWACAVWPTRDDTKCTKLANTLSTYLKQVPVRTKDGDRAVIHG